MSNFLWGLFWVGMGTLTLKFNRQIYNFTGAIDFIEEHWTAGTPSFLKIFSVCLVLFGLLLATGIGGWVVAPFTDMASKIFPKSN